MCHSVQQRSCQSQWGKAKTSNVPRKAFSAVYCSSFTVKMQLSPDKTATLSFLATVRLPVFIFVIFILVFRWSFQQWLSAVVPTKKEADYTITKLTASDWSLARWKWEIWDLKSQRYIRIARPWSGAKSKESLSIPMYIPEKRLLSCECNSQHVWWTTRRKGKKERKKALRRDSWHNLCVYTCVCVCDDDMCASPGGFQTNQNTLEGLLHNSVAVTRPMTYAHINKLNWAKGDAVFAYKCLYNCNTPTSPPPQHCSLPPKSWITDILQICKFELLLFFPFFNVWVFVCVSKCVSCV